MEKPTLVVLAAGIGSRYGGLKQFDPVGPGGELIIDYSIYDALKVGFGRVVFVIKDEIEEAFRERIGKKIEQRCDTRYVFQRLDDLPEGFEVPLDRRKPWGTGQATLSCKGVVDTPFAVINADDFYGRSAFQSLCSHLQGVQDGNGMHEYCMVGYRLENTLSEHGHVARGVCVVDADGYLQEIHERTRIEKFGESAKYTEDGQNWFEIPRGAPVSMNTWGFTPSLFLELDARFHWFLQASRANILKAEFFLPEVVGTLIQENRATVKVLSSDEQWFGITYQEDKPRVEKAILALIRQGVYPENLWCTTFPI
jgi:NDP-sugar pyrophosphorylase family protein